ncbi:MAG TPA: PQQ-binding-like beta-propeller repeat protein, partial [Sandaracinaceae bacterium]
MRTLAVVVALALAGCGGQAFAPSFRERAEPEMSRVLEAIAAAPAREETPVIVAVAPDGAIAAWDLREGRRIWSVSAEPTATPVIAGRYVVATEREGLSVRRLEDGARAFVFGDRELRLVGADAEGDVLVVTLARGEGQSPEGVVIGASGGAHRWTEELPLPVAVPAVVGSIAVIPWAHQRVSFLDASEGRERARLRLEDAVVGHARRHGARVLLGQHELFAIDDRLVEEGRRRDRFLRPAGRPLPGQPPLLPDGYEPRFSPDSARNRVRLAWALAEDGQSFTDGLVYFVFYRLVFALDATADDVRWVAALPGDVVGAAASVGGLMVVTEDGIARFLAAADGREGFRAQLGSPVRAAEIRLAGFASALEPSGKTLTLRAQIERAAALDDARLVGGRALAIRYL